VIYLYAITDEPDAASPLVSETDGVDAYALSYLDIRAVVSNVASTEFAPTEANLWLHEGIVEGLMATRTVLPVRFGTFLPDEAAVHAALESQYAEFKADLARVRGRVELGLRVLRDEDTPQPGESADRGTCDGRRRHQIFDSGRAYMLARLDEERDMRLRQERAEALALEIHRPLADLASESAHRTLVSANLLLTAAYLVDSGQVGSFRDSVEGISVAHPLLRILCTGPWPPYNFVSHRQSSDKDEHLSWMELITKR
jgi:hypothetical protein